MDHRSHQSGPAASIYSSVGTSLLPDKISEEGSSAYQPTSGSASLAKSMSRPNSVSANPNAPGADLPKTSSLPQGPKPDTWRIAGGADHRDSRLPGGTESRTRSREGTTAPGATRTGFAGFFQPDVGLGFSIGKRATAKSNETGSSSSAGGIIGKAGTGSSGGPGGVDKKRSTDQDGGFPLTEQSSSGVLNDRTPTFTGPASSARSPGAGVQANKNLRRLGSSDAALDMRAVSLQKIADRLESFQKLRESQTAGTAPSRQASQDRGEFAGRSGDTFQASSLGTPREGQAGGIFAGRSGDLFHGSSHGTPRGADATNTASLFHGSSGTLGTTTPKTPGAAGPLHTNSDFGGTGELPSNLGFKATIVDSMTKQGFMSEKNLVAPEQQRSTVQSTTSYPPPPPPSVASSAVGGLTSAASARSTDAMFAPRDHGGAPSLFPRGGGSHSSASFLPRGGSQQPSNRPMSPSGASQYTGGQYGGSPLRAPPPSAQTSSVLAQTSSRHQPPRGSAIVAGLNAASFAPRSSRQRAGGAPASQDGRSQNNTVDARFGTADARAGVSNSVSNFYPFESINTGISPIAEVPSSKENGSSATRSSVTGFSHTGGIRSGSVSQGMGGGGGGSVSQGMGVRSGSVTMGSMSAAYPGEQSRAPAEVSMMARTSTGGAVSLLSRTNTGGAARFQEEIQEERRGGRTPQPKRGPANEFASQLEAQLARVAQQEGRKEEETSTGVFGEGNSDGGRGSSGTLNDPRPPSEFPGRGSSGTLSSGGRRRPTRRTDGS